MSYQKENNSDMCEECGGKCCQFIMLECRKDDKYKLDFWKAQGNVKFGESETHVQYGQRCPCQHIGEDGKCDDYENRPQLCRDFPKQNLPRLWRLICPLWHERNKGKSKIMKVFKTT